MTRASIIVLVAGCTATSHVPSVRFANAPPVSVVDDRRDVAAKPSERPFFEHLYHYDGTFQRRLVRTLELPRHRRAVGVNAVDEVPDSTWFTNRIGARELTLDELRTGPVRIDSPELHKPWTVRSTKVGGSEIGFLVTDARGEKFLLKFDLVGFPEQETATHVIVGKLLWACGYNVTEDFLVNLRHDELVLAPDAVAKDKVGNKHPLTQAEFDRQLHLIEVAPDGSIRAMASRWLDGKALGGHPAEGVRDDDPNDRIAHQLRRDLRGAYPMFAWLDHVDIQESNFIDMWVNDAGDANRHYVKHFLIDFGKSLGVMATTGHDPRHGHEYVIDFATITRSFVTAGTRLRSWEDRDAPSLRGVGLFEADSYDPGAWKPDSPAYVPLLEADRVDKLWGAKILIRFTREQIRAIVETGRLSDARAVDYITDTLVARQRATAAYWFARTSPLDRFEITDQALCFDDPAITYAIDPAGTHYVVTRFSADQRALGAAVELAPGSGGRTCTGPLALSDDRDGYTIVEVTAVRATTTVTVFAYVARDPTTQTPRVIGIWRP